MAMIEKIWPSEQMSAALTNPSDNLENVDPADPQVSCDAHATGLSSCILRYMYRHGLRSTILQTLSH